MSFRKLMGQLLILLFGGMMWAVEAGEIMSYNSILAGRRIIGLKEGILLLKRDRRI